MSFAYKTLLLWCVVIAVSVLSVFMMISKIPNLFFSVIMSISITVALLIALYLLINHYRHKNLPISMISTDFEIDILEKDGSLVRFVKTSKIRPNVSDVRSYIERNLNADGKFEKLTVNIGHMRPAISPHKKFPEIENFFSEPLKKGQIYTRIFTCEVKDSLTQSTEKFLANVIYPSRTLSIRVIFPVERPCKAVRGYLRRGPIEINLPSPIVKEIGNGKKMAELVAKKPELGEVYTIEWDW